MKEINAIEVDNEESRRLLMLRTNESLKPKRTTKYLGKDSSEIGEGLIVPGTFAANKAFNSFIVSFLLHLFKACANISTEARHWNWQIPDQQGSAYPRERAPGQTIRLLQTVQVLVHESFAHRT